MSLTVEGQTLIRLEHVLQRLEAYLPAPPARVDWARSLAASWVLSDGHGQLRAVSVTDDIRLDDLLGIDQQKRQVSGNTAQFVRGLPANNVLLWGSRGTGKSSLIHGLLNQYAAEGLRVVEVDKYQLTDLAGIVSDLSSEPYRFIVFCDDLSFEAGDPAYKALKSALEGSVFSAPENVLIYATSNRRHLLPEYMSENEQATHVGSEVHQGESVEEKISLSDRFGLWISFYPFNQDQYLAVAGHWLRALASKHQVSFEWDEEVRTHALRWALARGTRSGRSAVQFARDWIGHISEG